MWALPKLLVLHKNLQFQVYRLHSHVSVSALIRPGSDQKHLLILKHKSQKAKTHNSPQYHTLQELAKIPRGANLSVSEILMKFQAKSKTGSVTFKAMYKK